MRTTIKHPVPNGIKLSFVIFDIQALWRSGLSRWLITKTAVYMSRDHEEVDGRVRVTRVMKSERAEQRSDQVVLIVRLSDCVSDTSLYSLRSLWSWVGDRIGLTDVTDIDEFCQWYTCKNLYSFSPLNGTDTSRSDLYCQHSLHWQTLLLVGSHAAPHRLEQCSLICTHHCRQLH